MSLTSVRAVKVKKSEKSRKHNAHYTIGQRDQTAEYRTFIMQGQDDARPFNLADIDR